MLIEIYSLVLLCCVCIFLYVRMYGIRYGTYTKYSAALVFLFEILSFCSNNGNFDHRSRYNNKC